MDYSGALLVVMMNVAASEMFVRTLTLRVSFLSDVFILEQQESCSHTCNTLISPFQVGRVRVERMSV